MSEHHDEATRRVRQLVLSGDNTLRNRGGGGRLDRARERSSAARAVAGNAVLAPNATTGIDRRLDTPAERPSR